MGIHSKKEHSKIGYLLAYRRFGMLLHRWKLWKCRKNRFHSGFGLDACIDSIDEWRKKMKPDIRTKIATFASTLLMEWKIWKIKEGDWRKLDKATTEYKDTLGKKGGRWRI